MRWGLDSVAHHMTIRGISGRATTHVKTDRCDGSASSLRDLKLFGLFVVAALSNRVHSGFMGDCLMARGYISKDESSQHHQQYLAKPGSRPYCSAMPTQALLADFSGAAYKLPNKVWENYDWSIQHCVLRGDNSPIPKH